MQMKESGITVHGDNMKNKVLKLKKDNCTLKGKVRLIDNDPRNPYTKKGAKATYGPWKKNLIVTVGKTAVLRRMGGIALLANEGQITYGAVGTSATAPAVSDIALGTEIERKAVSFQQVIGTTLTLRCYFAEAEAVGVLTEFGWFGEAATAAADSGTMFNHVQITKTKTTAKTLTAEQEIEIA